MSKQYLTQHTIDHASPLDIFSLAVTKDQILCASGSQDLRIYSTSDPDFPIAQTVKKVHPVGCHHIAVSGDGKKGVSVGFGGEAHRWAYEEGQWNDGGLVTAGEMWAPSLSTDGQYLAVTTFDGKINVWDLLGSPRKIMSMETQGSFGMCIDMDAEGRFTATGHESGKVYVFSNATGKLVHSLAGLIKSVRSVKFSPMGKYLAAAGDARVISLYDVSSGEQIAIMSGHGAWITSLDWSHTGEYLLSGSLYSPLLLSTYIA
ncbi:MAG: hypothetical protein Q9227_006472 [Pyrenula ochraceoflavens]